VAATIARFPGSSGPAKSAYGTSRLVTPSARMTAPDPERKSRPCSDRNGLPTDSFRILVAQEAIAKASPALLLASGCLIDTLSEEIPADL
jgi:hypothetical protein